MISLVAFLGNYGKKYEQNRHNVAWLFADSLSFSSKLSWQKKYKSQYASLPVDLHDGERRIIHFLKPETYMNLSGEAIGEAATFYKIKPEEILVVHDELELLPGIVSLKWSGGLGGHNGLRSTKAVLGTADFWRLRFGIGRPEHSDVSSYVLSNFSSDEKILFSQLWLEVGVLLQNLLIDDPHAYIKEWGKKKLQEFKL